MKIILRIKKIKINVQKKNKRKNRIKLNESIEEEKKFNQTDIKFKGKDDDNENEEIFEMMKDDNRIILLKHKERKSTLLTRVDGIRYASGEYIIQIDQDDMYLTNLLFEKLYNKSKELDVDIVQFNHYSNHNKKVIKKL